MDHIRELFKRVSDIGSRERRERKLRALCERIAGVSDPKFLTTEGAAKVILQLRLRHLRKFKKYETSKKILLGSLSARQRQMLRKENPFRRERDKLLRSIRQRGASYTLISKVSGLGRTRVYEILRRGGEKDGTN
jgi:hypothetical protein